MSVQALSWVLEHSETVGVTRLVMIGIANHVDARGEGWCYVEEVCRLARCSEKSYHRAVAIVTESGELEVDVQGGGSLRMRNGYRPNRYVIPGMTPSAGTRSRADHPEPGLGKTWEQPGQDVLRGGQPGGGRGGQPDHPRGGQGVQASIEEPSGNRHRTVNGPVRAPSQQAEQSPRATADEEEVTLLATACHIVAERRWATRSGVVANPTAWKRAVAGKATDECRAVAGWARMTPDALADAVEPPAVVTHPYPFGERPASRWDEPTVEGGAFVVRPAGP